MLRTGVAEETSVGCLSCSIVCHRKVGEVPFMLNDELVIHLLVAVVFVLHRFYWIKLHEIVDSELSLLEHIQPF